MHIIRNMYAAQLNHISTELTFARRVYWSIKFCNLGILNDTR
jgi:hypothetical protein